MEEKRVEESSRQVKVIGVFIYPVKSCRGIPVSSAPITPTGFRWDRQWLVVNSKGRAYTQRIEPRLALVQVQLPTEAFSEHWEPSNDSSLVISAPGMDPLKVSLNKPREILNDVSIWEWSGSALDEGDEASKWFSDFLGKPCRLVRFNETETRNVDPNYAAGFRIKFSDAYPFLLVSQGSVDELNKHLEEPVHVNRFRPNILVDGCEPFREDFWKEIRINKLKFRSAELCYRCKVPTINQENAIPGCEPNETLKKFRSDATLALNRKPQGRVYLGQMMVWEGLGSEGKENVIEVGDPIYVDKEAPSYGDVAA